MSFEDELKARIDTDTAHEMALEHSEKIIRAEYLRTEVQPVLAMAMREQAAGLAKILTDKGYDPRSIPRGRVMEKLNPGGGAPIRTNTIDFTQPYWVLREIYYKGKVDPYPRTHGYHNLVGGIGLKPDGNLVKLVPGLQVDYTPGWSHNGDVTWDPSVPEAARKTWRAYDPMNDPTTPADRTTWFRHNLIEDALLAPRSHLVNHPGTSLDEPVLAQWTEHLYKVGMAAEKGLIVPPVKFTIGPMGEER